MLPETWNLSHRRSDKRGEWVYIDRDSDGRHTAWVLLRQPDRDWRIVEVFFSRPNRGLNGIPERNKTYYPNGFKLADNRIDRMLRSYCETGVGLG